MLRLRAFGAVWLSLVLLLSTASGVAAAAPANDEPAAATPLRIGVPVEFDSSDATASAADPDDCDGSHGAFPGPFFASVWFSYTATARDRRLELWSPTMQGHPDDFLAITFVYARTPGGLELVDCTAYGNEASWDAVPGTTYMIMEAGLASAVTEEPEFSDRGGHGTITILRVTPDGRHYRGVDRFAYEDCGFRVEGTVSFAGLFRLNKGHAGDPTPYYFDNYEWHAVTTNPANGKWFREDGNGMYRDVRITNVEGTIYTFVAMEVGQPYSLTDMDGNKVYFDRGRIATTFMIDTKGDDDLANDEFIDGSWSVLADNGAHAGFFIEDWCAEVVIPLLGD